MIWMKKILSALIAAAIAVACAPGGAWADTFGGFTVTGDVSSCTYSSGVLTISGTGKSVAIRNTNTSAATTDRIKVASGSNVAITLEGVNISTADSDGMPANRGKNRPFDMDGATVALTLAGGTTNRLIAGRYATALFCPRGSKLTVNGSGTLEATAGSRDEEDDRFYNRSCDGVAAIGGEGEADEDNLKVTKIVNDYYVDPWEKKPDYNGDPRFRRWWKSGGEVSGAACGEIIIEGSAVVKAKTNTGMIAREEQDVVPRPGGGWQDITICYYMPGALDPNIVYPNDLDDPSKGGTYADFGQTEKNVSVVIGGYGGGPITIKDSANVEAIGRVKTTGIGSLSNDFEKITITGNAKVVAETGAQTENHNMDDVGHDYTYGPAIGWASYSPLGDSNVEIEISGRANVTATARFGCADIGGGRNGSGGNILITDNARVVAKGGDRAAGIGGGIGHNPSTIATGKGTITISGNAYVEATGGNDGAGIGGGACRNASSDPDRTGTNERNEGHSGTIIISENAEVHAKGGQCAPGIGSGGNDQKQPQRGACLVQGIIITTTNKVVATSGGPGANGVPAAESNIGPGSIAREYNANATERFRGVYVNISAQAPQSPPLAVKNSITLDPQGNIVIQGDVDLAPSNPISSITSANANVIAKALVDHLAARPDAKIISSGSSSTQPQLHLPETYRSQIPSNKIFGVTVDGVQSSTFLVKATAGTGGKVTGGGTYSDGDRATLTATPDDGYKFAAWKEGGSVVTNQAEYAFTVKRNRDLTAEFAPADSSGGGDAGPAPVLPPLDEEQQKYDPGVMTPQQKIDNLQQAAGSAGSAISGALDTGTAGGSGFNIVVSGGDGAVQMISSDKGRSGSASFTAGQNIVQEIYLLKPDTAGKPAFNTADALNGSVVTVDVGYREHVLLTFDQTITGGHMSIKIPTNDVIAKLSEHLTSASGIRGADGTYDLWMRIRDRSDRINTTLPLSISFEMSSGGSGDDRTGSSSGGGGGCASGAAALTALACLAAIRRRDK